jgi:hypothetical protein
MIKTKQKFDKKEKSILELDELFKNIGKECQIANEKIVKGFGDFKSLSDNNSKSL